MLARLRTSPEETFIEITFPEGFTLRQMGARLAAELAAVLGRRVPRCGQRRDDSRRRSVRQACTSLEGLLFPATYRVSNADSERQVVTRMVEQMERVGAQEEIDAGPTGVAADYTPYQILTIASMIEREAKTEEDRPLIARVIYNRLALNIPVADRRHAHLQRASPSELEAEGAITRLREVDTPWNTFTNTGLPATPIANPGRASIEAALHPAPNPSPGSAECAGLPADQCQWLYYVIADEQGNHAFSVTAEQFEADRQAAADAGLLDRPPSGKSVSPGVGEDSLQRSTISPVAGRGRSLA